MLISCNSHALHFVDDVCSGVLQVQDGTTTVLCYRFGDQIQEDTDPKYTRSCYIHPLYSLDGRVVTDDFPKDHPHHRGVFWTWPVVKTRGKVTQTWLPQKPWLRQHFVRWVKRGIDDGCAVFSCENVWKLEQKDEVAREQVCVRVHPVVHESRAIDVELTLQAVGTSLTLEGQPDGKKGYGGLCLRTAPFLNRVLLSADDGPKPQDIMDERHAWVDISTTGCGVAILVHPDHPEFPPPFFARNSYTGFLNPSWPGLKSVVLAPGAPVTLRYRLLIHRGIPQAGRIGQAYEEYRAAGRQ